MLIECQGAVRIRSKYIGSSGLGCTQDICGCTNDHVRTIDVDRSPEMIVYCEDWSADICLASGPTTCAVGREDRDCTCIGEALWILAGDADDDGVSVNGDRFAKEVETSWVTGEELLLLSPVSVSPGEHVCRTCVSADRCVVLANAYDQRVSVHGHCRTELIARSEVISENFFLLGPGRPGAGEDVGRADIGVVDEEPRNGLTGNWVEYFHPGHWIDQDARRDGVVSDSTDHNGVSADSYRATEAVARTGVGGIDLCLLRPGTTAACEDIR